MKLINGYLLFLLFVTVALAGVIAAKPDIYAPGKNIGFFVFSVTTIVILLYALASPEARRVNITLSTISVLISFYIAEIFYSYIYTDTLKNDIETRARNAKEYGVEFDMRTMAEILENEKKKGNSIWPVTPPGEWIKVGGITTSDGEKIFPFAGPSDIKNILCNESGEYVFFQSDEYGFINPHNQHTNRINAVLIGDSFTAGTCVNPEDSASGILNRSKHKVLNLGVPGTGAYIQYAIFSEYAVPLKPKNIFWIYFEGNDLQDTERESGYKILNAYVDEDFTQKLITKQLDIDDSLNQYLSNRVRSIGDEKNGNPFKEILRLQRITALLNIKPTKYSSTRVLKKLEKILLKVKTVTDTWGGSVYFVYLPEWSRYASNWKDSENYRGDVLRIATSVGFEIVDMDESIRKLDDPLAIFPFKKPGHYNESGYQLLGNAIADRL